MNFHCSEIPKIVINNRPAFPTSSRSSNPIASVPCYHACEEKSSEIMLPPISLAEQFCTTCYRIDNATKCPSCRYHFCDTHITPLNPKKWYVYRDRSRKHHQCRWPLHVFEYRYEKDPANAKHLALQQSYGDFGFIEIHTVCSSNPDSSCTIETWVLDNLLDVLPVNMNTFAVVSKLSSCAKWIYHFFVLKVFSLFPSLRNLFL